MEPVEGLPAVGLQSVGVSAPDRVLTNIPSTDPVDVVVRVYIIKVGVASW